MKTSTVFALGLVIVIVSFLGFVTENVWLGFTKGIMDNRNMSLPFLLGYGLAIVAVYLLFGTPMNMHILGRKIFPKHRLLRVIAYFLCVMICVSVGEILLGTFVEKYCGIIWWDYTRLPLHITRYTSVFTSMAFASLITVFMAYFFPGIMEFAMDLKLSSLIPVTTASLTLLVIDFIKSAKHFFTHRCFKSLYQINLRNRHIIITQE